MCPLAIDMVPHKMLTKWYMTFWWQCYFVFGLWSKEVSLMKEIVIGFSFMMHVLWWTIIMAASSYCTTMKPLNMCSRYYNGDVISYQTWRNKRQRLPLLYQHSLNGQLKQIFYTIVKPFLWMQSTWKKLKYPYHLHNFLI